MTEDDVLKERYDRVRAEKKNMSGKISDICRFIGFGLLAAFYTIYTDDQRFGALLSDGSWAKFLLISFAFAGAVAIFFDYMQYAAGYRSVKDAIGADNKMYRDESWAYWIWNNAFLAKQAATLIGCLALIAFIFTV
jgi:hypothetical protein